jgi:acyl-CoA dehydrogenase
MSVPYDLLSNSQNGHISASERIPVIARPFVSERAAKTLDIVSYNLGIFLLNMRY